LPTHRWKKLSRKYTRRGDMGRRMHRNVDRR
jgi:hypothetical protein